MALKDTVITLKSLLMHIHRDLDKASKGNKAASQRVRTNSIKFAKAAKMYRKESISEGKKGKSVKKAPAKKAGKKKKR